MKIKLVVRKMKLFKKINIGPMELKNRIVMPAMHTGFGSDEGYVTDRMIRYYEERAKGGVALIIVEFTAVERRGRSATHELLIDDDKYIPMLSKLARAIQGNGAKACIQLHHGGGKVTERVSKNQPICPSVLEEYRNNYGNRPRLLTKGEIRKLVLSFGDAAVRAKEAGFDCIELHFTHSYLVDQFISPRFNKRKDAFGGNIENRIRFGSEIIENIRKRVGNFPIICRVTGSDYMKGGITTEDAKANAVLLERAGADCLHVSVGISKNVVSTPPMSIENGCFVYLAQQVKKAVKLPVIAVGKLSDPWLAEKVIVDKKADCIAIGRGLIADPFLPEKVENGGIEEIQQCLYCNQGCICKVLGGETITCVVNPSVGKEDAFSYTQSDHPRRVLIVGGGPAGMKAAIVARSRGHDVILAERKRELGGLLKYANRPPGKDQFDQLRIGLIKQIKESKIETHLNQNVGKDFVAQINPDVIVMATGSKPVIPVIPGIEETKIYLPTEILEMEQIDANSAIIIGGGQTGLETSEYLAQKGLKVTILEMLSEVGANIPKRNRQVLLNRIAKEEIKICENRKVTEINKNGVSTVHFGKREKYYGDILVVASGAKPENELLDELESILPKLKKCFLIGDCIEPRSALEAIYEGALVGMEV